jgi:hypothetical protein
MEGDDQQVAVKISYNSVQYFWRRQYRWFCLHKSDNECIVVGKKAYAKPLLIGIVDNKWVYRNVYIKTQSSSIIGSWPYGLLVISWNV